MLDTQKKAIHSGSSKIFSSVLLTGSMLLFVLKPGISKGNDAVKEEIQQVLKQYPTKEIVVKVQENTNAEKTAKFETTKDTSNALTFAQQNVSKYYPDMKEHLDTLLNHFRDQEQKDTVNFLFQEHIFKNITDEKDQITAILYCIERFVFKGNDKIEKKFSTKYDIGINIDDDEYIYLINFNKGYNKRFKGYYIKLERTITTMKEQNQKMKEQNQKMKEQNQKMKEQNQKMKEQNQKMKEQNQKMKEQNQKMKEQNQKMKEQNQKMKEQNQKMKEENQKMKEEINQLDKEIEQIRLENQKAKKETEGILNTFTKNDVKNNPQVKKLVLDVEQLYIFAEFEIYPHLAELIKIAKE